MIVDSLLHSQLNLINISQSFHNLSSEIYNILAAMHITIAFYKNTSYSIQYQIQSSIYEIAEMT